MSNSGNQPNLKPLQELVLGEWDATAEQNRKALGDGWAVAEDFVRLHAWALRDISRAAGRNPTKSQQAVILLGGHGFNLFVDTIGLTVRGHFDVAAYLLCGLFDCPGLLYAAGSSDELAEEFFAGRLTAADARKKFIADARQKGLDAEWIERQWKDDYRPAQKLAHLQALHLDKLVDVRGGILTPVALGRHDPHQSHRTIQLAFLQEVWILILLEAFGQGHLSEDWHSRHDKARTRFSEYMKQATSGG